MPQGGQAIDPGIIARVVAGVRYMVTGVSPDTFFGPGQPQEPGAQQIAGRRFDYQVGYNYRLSPRNDELISFAQLRGLADGYDLLRLVIETRKDQIEALDFSVKKRDGGKPGKKDGPDSTAQKIEAFLRYPDQQHTWSIWLRMLLEDLFVIDAPVIYPRLTRGGDLYSLDIIDGATIKLVLDDSGRTPTPPDVAYQQVIKGLPAVDYSRDELLYLARNLRSHKVYGYSPVEQVIATVNIALRRQVSQLQYYSEGNIPEALIGVPAGWNPDQIRQFQEYWDSILEGNTGQRRHAKFIPGDIAKNYVPTREPVLKDEYDEWLARIVCFAFSIPPTQFVKQQNRATAETALQQAKEEGIAPLLKYIKAFMDMIIARYFKQPGYEFSWRDDEQVDPLAQAQANDYKVRNGTKTINEVRADDGLDPDPDGDQLMVYTATGPVLLADVLDPPEPVAMPGQPVPGQEPQQDGAQPPAKGEEVGKLAAGPFAKRARPTGRLTPIRNTRPQVNKGVRKLKRTIAASLKATGKDVAEQLRRRWPAVATVTHQVAKMAPPDDARLGPLLEALDLSGLDAIVDPTEAEIARIFGDAGKKALAQVGISDQGITSQVHQEAVDYAAERAAELVGKKYHGEILVDNPAPGWSIKESTRDMLRSTIGQALEEGWSADRLADEIEDNAAFGSTRAETIARTELAFANTNGAMQGYRASGVVTGKVWLLGEEACDECQGNADAGEIGIDDTFPSGDDAPPAHPNCLPGDTLVTTDSISAASKRWYDGDLVVIRTASGNKLAGTPNHPVLTPGGWVALGRLYKGSNVISSRCADWMPGTGLDHQDVPPSIEDVAEALGRSKQMTPRPMPVAAEDFHGDGVGSEVAIVWSDGLLLDRIDPALKEEAMKLFFGAGNMQPPRLDGSGSLDFLLERMLASTNRLMRSGGASAALTRVECGLMNAQGLGLPSDSNAGLDEPLMDRAARCAEAFSKCENSNASGIFADEVIDIERQAFHGFVYNLQTVGGFYVAAGIVTHNCVCNVSPIVGDDSEETDE